jgi:hypothetical protein
MVENESLPDDALTSELWLLLQLWRSKSLMLGRLPQPGEIVPVLAKRWLRHAALIEPGARAGFVFRSCGFDLIRRFGRLAHGHRVSALAPGIRQGLSRMLLLALRRRGPVVWRPAVMLGRDPIRFGEVILPLSRDGQGIDVLLLLALEERRVRVVTAPEPEAERYLPDWEHD